MTNSEKKQHGGRKWWLSLAFLCLPSLLSAEMATMDDAELSTVSGQALFMASKQTQGSYNFYRMGFDALLELNANISELRLGETLTGGVNTPDILARNVALGCIANAANVCVDSTSGTGTQLKPFSMLRPFIQIAVKNDGNRALREVVGIRLGAENVSGPMSIGNFEMFSGYLSATANIEMQEQGKGRNPDDVAVTCGTLTAPCPGSGPFSPGTNTFGLQEPARSLGLNNDQACFLSICAQFKDLTASYDGVLRSNLPVTINGRRQNQAFIGNLFLSDAVDQIANSMAIERSNAGLLSAGLINALLPILRGNVSNKIKSQLATGLGTTTANLNSYQMPYNVQNLHQADINSPLFGLSFQKEAGVQYPGYVVAMQKGWSMYMPNAFTLSVSQPTTIFVSNIMSGAAREGNVVQLPVGGGRNVYDNCWGTAVFC